MTQEQIEVLVRDNEELREKIDSHVRTWQRLYKENKQLLEQISTQKHQVQPIVQALQEAYKTQTLYKTVAKLLNS